MTAAGERGIFEAFLENADQLAQHSVVRLRTLKIETRISASETGLVVSRHPINEELLESLLVRVRRFANQKDMLYLPRILGRLQKHISGKKEDQALADISEQFMSAGKYAYYCRRHKGKSYGEEDIFKLYVNGKIFHYDPVKSSSLAAMTEPTLFDYDMFVSAAINKVNAVLRTRMCVREKGLADPTARGQ